MLTPLLLLTMLVVLLLWRSQPMLAVGIAIGATLGWIIGATADMPKLESIPIWLPPLPFAVVALVLFFFGILAWVWGKDREGDGHPGHSEQHSDAPHSH
jgi:hypothetical protein